MTESYQIVGRADLIDYDIKCRMGREGGTENG